MSSCRWPNEARRLKTSDREFPCAQEVLKGLDHKSLSEDVVKHAQYHYNPGRDIVFRGEFIPVRLCLLPSSDPNALSGTSQAFGCSHQPGSVG